MFIVNYSWRKQQSDSDSHSYMESRQEIIIHQSN